MAAAPHGRLDAYKRALAALAKLEGICRWIPPARLDLRDQLQRAAASVVLNVAEGAAEFSPAEKARFYRIARRSAAESIAALDILEVTTGPPPDAGDARRLLEDVMAMTTRLVQSAELRRK